MRQILHAARPELTERQLDRLCEFWRRLAEKNKVMNLTAITDDVQAMHLHVLDSLALLDACELSHKQVIDVGCGAGFPGVPLLIGEPALRLTLLDSQKKRIDWLSEMVAALELSAVCVCDRAEEYAAKHREAYDISVSRAVARLNILCELCLPLARVGGTFLAMKGAAAKDEVREARAAIRLLGGEVDQIFEYPILDAVHRVVVIQKVQKTPPQYPRRFAKIRKSPL